MDWEIYDLPDEIAPLPPDIRLAGKNDQSTGGEASSEDEGGKTPGTLMKRLKKYAMVGALVLGGATYTGSLFSGAASSGENESRAESEAPETEDVPGEVSE